MSEKVNVHLIDGTYELFRSYFGAPEAKAPDGREVGAVRGLMASLYGLLREEATSHMAVAFDTVVASEDCLLEEGAPSPLSTHAGLSAAAAAAHFLPL